MLREICEAYLREQGFYPVLDNPDDPPAWRNDNPQRVADCTDRWTCDAWKDWWRKPAPKTPEEEAWRDDRDMSFKELVGQVMWAENNNERP